MAATIIGLLATHLRSDDSFSPQVRADPVRDILGWLPATDTTRRAYAVWISGSGPSMSPSAALDTLFLTPAPLALGRSSEWQRLTGVSASQVTGWASANGGITVLEGTFVDTEISSKLMEGGFSQSTHRGVDIWSAPEGTLGDQIVSGDDLRGLAAIAVVGNRLLIAHSVDLLESALDAASGESQSLADERIVELLDTGDMSGLAVVDSRDLAIDCGVGGDWLLSDFSEPSGEAVAVAYRQVGDGTIPVTSVWVQYPDEIEALVGSAELEREWADGYINRLGLGGKVSDLATVDLVYAKGDFVVADLSNGRDNGWIRTGIRYLVGVCEHASTLIPSGSPQRATPVASPSPME